MKTTLAFSVRSFGTLFRMDRLVLILFFLVSRLIGQSQSFIHSTLDSLNPTAVDQRAYAGTMSTDANLTVVPVDGAEFTPQNNLPFFPGGQRELQAYFNKLKLNTHSSPLTPREGKVLVGFRVMATGELTQISLLRSSDPRLVRVALKAVTNMPRWYPAHREGVAVSCLYILPITFRFNGLTPSSFTLSETK